MRNKMGKLVAATLFLLCCDWLEGCFNTEQPQVHYTNDADDSITATDYGDRTPEERKGTYVRLRSASKPHSTPQTLKWLEDNYEIADGVCIPRSTLYVHYLDYCEKKDTQPVNAASFGKIIRQQFPQLTTRRLGTRGQSKYHYYGIGVRESSLYYDVSYSSKGIQSAGDGRKDSSKQIIAYSPRSKLGTLLPDFPDIKEINLPSGISHEKVLTFLMMYRTHCQRILDTVIRANFDEVQSFLLHFWQGMPVHMKSLLECNVLVTLVGVCDSILYRAIANVLMPTVLQPLPESLTQVIRKFSVQLDQWLRQALDSLPTNLQKIKFDLARRFSQVLKRQTSLNHLCQAARTVIHSAEITSQMLDDWINVDLNSITKQTLYTTDNYADIEYNAILKLTRDFEMLLEDQAPLESYISWLDNMVDQCVTQKSCQQPVPLKKTARQFLLMWSCFGTRVIRDMTLHSAPSFGSFHLLHLMFDEYVMYLVENLHNQDKADELLKVVKGEQNIDFLEDLAEIHASKETSCFTDMSSKVPCDVDRTSVIRGPECSTLHHTGNIESVPQFTAGTQPDQTCYQQTTPYNEHRRQSLSCSGQYSQMPSFTTPLDHGGRQKQLGYQSNHTVYSNHASQTENNNNASNEYDWNNWSTAGQYPDVQGMTINKIQNEDVCPSFKHNDFQFNHYNVSNQHHNFTNFCGDIKSCRRTGLEEHGVKRKTDDGVQGLSPKETIPNMYQYHVTNLI